MGEDAGTSRVSGLYRLSPEERREVLMAFVEAQGRDVSAADLAALSAPPDLGLLDRMVENAIGAFPLPLGIAANFLVDGEELLVPMVIEEPSVVAAASNSARLVRAGGGFATESLGRCMIGQIQLCEVPDAARAVDAMLAAEEELCALANVAGGSIEDKGGGCRGIETRVFPPSETGEGTVIVLHLVVDTCDAMGANVVNTMCEAVAPRALELSGGRLGLRILSNLADQRRVRARCRVRAEDLRGHGFSGGEVVDRIVSAARFAEYDPYRAATHNKGILNGIDAVVLATGNDWRAVEAGIHAWAARDGRYRSVSRWSKDADGDLRGELEVPLQLGTVGGVTREHPVARFAHRLLGIDGADKLARITAAVGLAQNLGALRALATEGIQRGHMRLHARKNGR